MPQLPVVTYAPEDRDCVVSVSPGSSSSLTPDGRRCPWIRGIKLCAKDGMQVTSVNGRNQNLGTGSPCFRRFGSKSPRPVHSRQSLPRRARPPGPQRRARRDPPRPHPSRDTPPQHPEGRAGPAVLTPRHRPRHPTTTPPVALAKPRRAPSPNARRPSTHRLPPANPSARRPVHRPASRLNPHSRRTHRPRCVQPSTRPQRPARPAPPRPHRRPRSVPARPTAPPPAAGFDPGSPAPRPAGCREPSAVAGAGRPGASGFRARRRGGCRPPGPTSRPARPGMRRWAKDRRGRSARLRRCARRRRARSRRGGRS